MIAAPLATSCRSTRETISVGTRRDSLAWDRQVSVSLAQIPARFATMEIPTDSLRKLPEGAIFSQRDGHLTLDLSMRGDTIVATAKSDSLSGMELVVNESLRKQEKKSSEERSSVTTGWRTSVWRLLLSFVAGFLLGLFVGRKL